MTTPDQPDGDRYGDWDAAYVLGALSPADRSEFETHLAACPRCQGAVSEIAGLPGLLSQVGPEDAAQLTDPQPLESPPESLLPTVLATVRSQRNRTRTRLLAVAAGLALVLGGFLLAQVLGRVVPGVDQRIAFEPVGSSGITAIVQLVPLPTGTRVEVECQDAAGAEVGSSLSVVVADTTGRRQPVKEWVVQPDKVNRPSGETSWRISQIDAVEIRETTTDALVMRARVG